MSSNDSSQDNKALLEQFMLSSLFEEMKDNVELYQNMIKKSVNKFTQVLKLNGKNANIPKEMLNEYELKVAAILQPRQAIEENSNTAIRQQTSHTTFEAVATHAAPQDISVEAQSRSPIEPQSQSQSQAPVEAQQQSPIETQAQTNESDNSTTETCADPPQANSTSPLEEELDECAAQSSQNLSKRGKFIMLSVTCPERNCGDQFGSMRELELHQFKKHKIQRFPCPQLDCKESFQTKAQLVVHKEKAHKRVTVWQCKICKRKFENTTKCADRFEGLIRHYKENHYLGEYKCIRCDTVSTNQAKANRHYDIKCTAKPIKARTEGIYNPEEQRQQQQPPQPAYSIPSQLPNAEYTPHAMPNGMFVPNLMQSTLKMSTATTVTDFFSVGPRNASQQSQQQTGQNQQQQQQFPADTTSQYQSAESLAKSPIPVHSMANSLKFVKGHSKSDNKTSQSSKK